MRLQRECDTNDMSATQVKNFDFDNGTSEDIFTTLYWANESLQGEGQLHSKNYHLEMPCSLAKMRLKRVPQKLNFVMAKATSSYTLDCCCKCPCMFPHSDT